MAAAVVLPVVVRVGEIEAQWDTLTLTLTSAELLRQPTNGSEGADRVAP